MSELNILSYNSWNWNAIFKFRNYNESSNEIHMSVIDQRFDFKYSRDYNGIGSR